MSWYTGPKMLELLESIQVDDAAYKLPFRFAVQLVSRPPASPEFPDFRGYMGRVASGSVKVGDRIVVLPSGARSTVTGIVTRDGNLDEAFARQSVTLTLADDLDISRGDMHFSRRPSPCGPHGLQSNALLDERTQAAPQPSLCLAAHDQDRTRDHQRNRLPIECQYARAGIAGHRNCRPTISAR